MPLCLSTLPLATLQTRVLFNSAYAAALDTMADRRLARTLTLTLTLTRTPTRTPTPALTLTSTLTLTLTLTLTPTPTPTPTPTLTRHLERHVYSQLNLAGLRRLGITIGTRTVELLGWVRP